jgi:hypothetical protein
MENSKSIVESTLLQIKAVEDAISENAKGILASTMKEEISELVRESLGSKKRRIREQEENEPETDVEVDAEEGPEGTEEPEEIDVDVDVDDEGEEPMMGQEPMMGDNEMPPLDMTSAPMSDVLKVFKAMGDQDGIIVAKDEDDFYLKDGENEYIIRTGADETNTQTQMGQPMKESVLYELVLNEQGRPQADFNENLGSFGRDFNEEYPEMDELYMGGIGEQGNEEREGTIYELEMDEQGDYENPYPNDDVIVPSESIYEVDMDELADVMESFKAKGVGMGKPKFSYEKQKGGFKEDRKYSGKSSSKGPKFNYSKIKHGVTETEMDEEEFEGWEREENEGMMMEPKEASRTLGNGKYWGRKGLPKVRTAPRHLKVESVNEELSLLKEKNDEYKKALDFFRTKLNEVAVFNSNLAYSTRLFTEHSTTKQEKINILRRFDGVESLKESKNLYQSIKKELDGNSNVGVVTESIQRKVIKTPQTGSSSNLIESKTYENPQFLRMKDLMTKIK